MFTKSIEVSISWYERRAARASHVAGSASALQRIAADRAVARAELVRLQAVEDAQDFLGVAADVQVVDRDVLDHVVRVDDERRPQGNTFLLVAHAQLVDERARRIGELVMIEAREVL